MCVVDGNAIKAVGVVEGAMAALQPVWVREVDHCGMVIWMGMGM